MIWRVNYFIIVITMITNEMANFHVKLTVINLVTSISITFPHNHTKDIYIQWDFYLQKPHYTKKSDYEPGFEEISDLFNENIFKTWVVNSAILPDSAPPEMLVVSSCDCFVVVVSSPHQSPRCGVWRVEKVWKFWLPTMSVGNPATKRQLPFGSIALLWYIPAIFNWATVQAALQLAIKYLRLLQAKFCPTTCKF